MALGDIIGFNLTHANHRRRHSTYFFRKSASDGESDICMALPLKGTGYYDFGSGAVAVKPGVFLFYGAKSLKKSWGDPHDPPSYLLLGFDLVDRLGRLAQPPELDIAVLNEIKNTGPVRRLMQKIVEEWRTGGHYCRLNCSVLGLKLLKLLDHSLRPFKPYRRIRGRVVEDEQMMEVLQYIVSRPREKFSAANLAARAGLKSATFYRRFRSVTGMPPYRYILRRKMEHAKEKLLWENEPLQSAADDLGFNDYSNFHRAFKKYTGLSPTAFCEKYRRGNA